MPGFGDSAANPPQVNYYQLTSGDHGASAAASAAAHQAAAMMLTAEITQMSTSTSSTAAVGWQGAGGAAMTMTAQAFSSILGVAVAWFEEAFAQNMAIVDAYNLAATTMIPGPVSDQNLVDTEALVASNILGQNTPAIVALVAEYEHQWVQNAAIMSTYQAVVAAALAVLATPPPFAPMAPNPAAALAALADAGAQAGVQGALQASSQSMQQASTAAVPASEAMSAPGDALSSMSGMAGQLSSVTGMAGQLPQMLGQAPQMLSQFAQMPMGLLGQLGSGMGGGMGGATPGTVGGAPLTGTPAAALTGGGAGGVGGGGTGVAPTSTYTRPVGSFSTPNAPKLPGGFGGAPEPVPAGGRGAGAGGLYGAPPTSAMGRDGAGSSEPQRQGRTMQVTLARGDRGDR